VHRQWTGQQVFDEPALNRVATYRGGLAAREAELAAVEAELAAWAVAPPLVDTVAKLGAYRGIAQLTGMTLAAEVVDWRRFANRTRVHGLFRTDPQRVLQRGAQPPGSHHQGWPGGRAYRADRGSVGIPAPAGNRGHPVARRQAGVSAQTLARSWTAQQRLHAKYKKMTARGKPPGVAVVAIARELAGFVWAEMTN
jgi:transposase